MSSPRLEDVNATDDDDGVCDGSSTSSGLDKGSASGNDSTSKDDASSKTGGDDSHKHLTGAGGDTAAVNRSKVLVYAALLLAAAAIGTATYFILATEQSNTLNIEVRKIMTTPHLFGSFVIIHIMNKNDLSHYCWSMRVISPPVSFSNTSDFFSSLYSLQQLKK